MGCLNSVGAALFDGTYGLSKFVFSEVYSSFFRKILSKRDYFRIYSRFQCLKMLESWVDHRFLKFTQEFLWKSWVNVRKSGKTQDSRFSENMYRPYDVLRPLISSGESYKVPWSGESRDPAAGRASKDCGSELFSRKKLSDICRYKVGKR